MKRAGRFIINKLRNWKKLQRKRAPIITVEVSKSALLHNLSVIQSLVPDWQVAPVLKSNAYGHGLILVADILKNVPSVPFFCVDTCFEAELIRNFGIAKPLLILGYTSIDTIKNHKSSDIIFVVGSLEQLKTLIERKVRARIHLKFDTGMHRQGIPYTNLEQAMELTTRSTTLQIEGILSHLADAETPNSKLTKQQIKRWNELVHQLQKNFPTIRYYHISNSAGFAYAHDITANLGRTGKAFYGINPGNFTTKLKPALCMKATISEIRTIKADETVGYNGTFIAECETKIATVPIGYYEGVDRRLSGKGIFLIDGKRAPLLGNISMNISSCDISDIDTTKIGSLVVVISNQSGDQNSIESIARLCNTIPAEILVHIPAHLRRNVIE